MMLDNFFQNEMYLFHMRFICGSNPLITAHTDTKFKITISKVKDS